MDGDQVKEERLTEEVSNRSAPQSMPSMPMNPQAMHGFGTQWQGMPPTHHPQK